MCIIPETCSLLLLGTAFVTWLCVHRGTVVIYLVYITYSSLDSCSI